MLYVSLYSFLHFKVCSLKTVTQSLQVHLYSCEIIIMQEATYSAEVMNVQFAAYAQNIYMATASFISIVQVLSNSSLDCAVLHRSVDAGLSFWTVSQWEIRGSHSL